MVAFSTAVGAEVPLALVAETLKLYADAAVRPETTAEFVVTVVLV